MHVALEVARASAERNEVPVGAIVVYEGRIVGQGRQSAGLEYRSYCPCRDSRVARSCRHLRELPAAGREPFTSPSSPVQCARAR